MLIKKNPGFPCGFWRNGIIVLMTILLLGCSSNGARLVDNSGGFARGPQGTKLKVLKMVAPEFPSKFQIPGSKDVVVIQLCIKPNGTTCGTKVLKSSREALNQYAVKAVSQWQFEPYDASIAPFHWVAVPLTFSLE
ncbi:TonB family protein [Methylomonas sp. ZR1]|uniref:TonB family protein n=1 Tax=Methylomonas sp. ZR1 TaxID=1797072 RepID=UPI0014925F1D|nr:TonB family protein [Methylomonas sp. ZR1]NOV31959.1 TonB family protein [Methylomonas sp. ZR1]